MTFSPCPFCHRPHWLLTFLHDGKVSTETTIVLGGEQGEPCEVCGWGLSSLRHGKTRRAPTSAMRPSDVTPPTTTQERSELRATAPSQVVLCTTTITISRRARWFSFLLRDIKGLGVTRFCLPRWQFPGRIYNPTSSSSLFFSAIAVTRFFSLTSIVLFCIILASGVKYGQGRSEEGAEVRQFVLCYDSQVIPNISRIDEEGFSCGIVTKRPHHC